MSSKPPAGIRETVEITVNNNINRTHNVLNVRINDTVGSLVRLLKSQNTGNISIDFSGTNLVFVNESETLASIGITEGSTLDISAANSLVGGV